jgi:hypothetical protein
MVYLFIFKPCFAFVQQTDIINDNYLILYHDYFLNLRSEFTTSFGILFDVFFGTHVNDPSNSFQTRVSLQ